MKTYYQTNGEVLLTADDNKWLSLHKEGDAITEDYAAVKRVICSIGFDLSRYTEITDEQHYSYLAQLEEAGKPE